MSAVDPVETLRACRFCRRELPLERFHLAGKGEQRRTECADCSNARERFVFAYGRAPSSDEILAAQGVDVPGGASREEVARAMGISPRLVEEIERAAIAKLRSRLLSMWREL